mmetsp:Transcript_145875/g.406305  ORF Transcript_145875/g.406305 Transcript_145875/m.406305 type:complete len:222 (-) Transcript_145875:95-760(-)
MGYHLTTRPPLQQTRWPASALPSRWHQPGASFHSIGRAPSWFCHSSERTSPCIACASFSRASGTLRGWWPVTSSGSGRGTTSGCRSCPRPCRARGSTTAGPSRSWASSASGRSQLASWWSTTAGGWLLVTSPSTSRPATVVSAMGAAFCRPPRSPTRTMGWSLPCGSREKRRDSKICWRKAAEPQQDHEGPSRAGTSWRRPSAYFKPALSFPGQTQADVCA